MSLASVGARLICRIFVWVAYFTFLIYSLVQYVKNEYICTNI